MEIPEYIVLRYSPEIGKKQLAFYNKCKKEWQAGRNTIDAGENYGYLYRYLADLCFEFERTKDHAKHHEMCQVMVDYPFKTFSTFKRFKLKARRVQNFSYFLTGDYDTFWERYIRSEINPSLGEGFYYVSLCDIRTFFFETSNPVVTAPLLLQSCNNVLQRGLTEYGVDNINELLEVMAEYIDEFKQEKGKDPISYYIERYHTTPIEEERVAELESVLKYKEKEINHLLADYRSWFKYRKDTDKERHDKDIADTLKRKDKHFKIFQDTYKRRKKEFKNNWFIRPRTSYYHWYGTPIYFAEFQEAATPKIIRYAYLDYVGDILRECENRLRVKTGIPKIGEGWVSETKLFRSIEKHFKNDVVKQHGRPKWLGRQHLDVYLPEWNIALEYQGAQHDRPVDFFGGEEQFEIIQRNDRKKARLCEENECILIYVYPKYKLKDVLEDVHEALAIQKERKQLKELV